MPPLDPLNDHQHARLDALMGELATLPTPESIVEAVRIRGIDATTEDGKAIYRTAFAGGIAAQKVMSYLEALRDIEQSRNTLGRAIHAHVSKPKPVTTEEVEIYARESLIAGHNAGVQEVTIHFFCNCVMHLHKLLKKAAEGAGYEIPEEDLAVLNAYRDLRNYFEHIENRLPGHANAAEAVRETSTADEWRIQSHLEVDDKGRIILKGKAVDVTGRGLRDIEAVVQKIWEPLKPTALEGARRFFLAHPADIPGPEMVRQTFIFSV